MRKALNAMTTDSHGYRTDLGRDAAFDGHQLDLALSRIQSQSAEATTFLSCVSAAVRSLLPEYCYLEIGYTSGAAFSRTCSIGAVATFTRSTSVR